MGFCGVNLQYNKYHSILFELKVQLANNLVVNVIAVVVPHDKLYFIIGLNILRGLRSKLWTLSNSDLPCIVAIDDKTSNIKLIHYLKKHQEHTVAGGINQCSEDQSNRYPTSFLSMKRE